jgi:4-amino-4-deoxy-L-arabinose transferase-like glycosyltransferase
MIWSRIKTSPLLLIIIMAILLRLAVLLALPSVFAFEKTGVYQGIRDYDTYAQNLLQNGVYGAIPGKPDALIPPLYAYSLAVVYAIFGRGSFQVGCFQILLDVLSILLLYHIGKRIMPLGRSVALLACLFYAAYPYLIFQNLTIIDTPIFMALLYGFVFTMILLREQKTFTKQTWALSMIGGLLLGVGSLSRAVIAPLALFVAVWFLFRLSFWQTVLRLLPVVVVSILVLIPWTLRNYNLYGSLVAVTTNAGGNFWIGNSPYTVPFFKAGYHTHWLGPLYGSLDGLNDYQKNARMQEYGVTFLKENPDKIPELLWVKFLAYWSIDVFPTRQPTAEIIENYKGLTTLGQDSQNNVVVAGVPLNDPSTIYSQPLFDQIGRSIHRFYFGGLFFFALIGIALTLRFWRNVSLLWFVQVSMTLIYVIIVPATRYRAPTDPLLFLFSGYTLVVIFKYFWRKDSVQKFISHTPFLSGIMSRNPTESSKVHTV